MMEARRLDGTTAENARLCEWVRLLLSCVPAVLWVTDGALRITAYAGVTAREDET